MYTILDVKWVARGSERRGWTASSVSRVAAPAVLKLGLSFRASGHYSGPSRDADRKRLSEIVLAGRARVRSTRGRTRPFMHNLKGSCMFGPLTRTRRRWSRPTDQPAKPTPYSRTALVLVLVLVSLCVSLSQEGPRGLVICWIVGFTRT